MNKEYLKEEIQKYKKEKDAVILAHVYQGYDVQEIADVTGDSFALAQAAARVTNKTVLMCGVTFMAETVKILSPDKTVILPEPEADCPMAEMLAPEQVVSYKKAHPDCFVAAYINTTAQLKSVCDVCVTSSSAVQIIKNIDTKHILFVPDKNLGAYVAKKVPDRRFVFMDGYCPAHNRITKQDILNACNEYPNVPVAIHPECRPEAVALCDMVGSTTEIMAYAVDQPGQVLIATESGVTEYLNQKHNTDRFIQIAPEKLICDSMKKTTLKSIYGALTGRQGQEIIMPQELMDAARHSIDQMLKLGSRT